MLGTVPVLDVAIETGWMARYHFALQNGRLVVAALNIQAKDPDKIPTGGLTARLLRQVRAGDHVRHTRKLFQLLPGWTRGWTPMEQVLAATLGADPPEPATPRRSSQAASPRRVGRRPISDDTLLRVAVPYADAVAKGSRSPVADVATRLKETRERVTHLVHLARLPRHGLLTPGVQGRAGGDLTDRARALVKKNRKRQRSGRRA
jgi:hypothetical protein